MHSHTVWKTADEPNYSSNIDLDYPYSDKLVKIPISLNNLIKHVDYWGEGRVESEEGIRGFPNSYNINHQYRLVSSGPDKDKKIPNRIPVISYTDCDTSAYIKDNSVLIVTIPGTHITSSCAKDIARIVNNDYGKVVVYGVNSESPEISDLAVELEKKELLLSKDFSLPTELQCLTYYESHVAFVNKNEISVLKNALYNCVVKGDYDAAVKISRSVGEGLSEIVTKLISSAPRNVLPYTYKLWHADGQDIVRKHFPNSFQHIIGEHDVTIANQVYDMALKLDNGKTNNNRAIWGDSTGLPRTSVRLSWKFFPKYDEGQLTFTLYNVDHQMFIRMDDTVDYTGDRECWGSTMNEEDSSNNRYKFYLEPSIADDGSVVFIIINVHHNKQGLKLEVKVDKDGDRKLWGHNGNIYDIWSMITLNVQNLPKCTDLSNPAYIVNSYILKLLPKLLYCTFVSK